MPIETRSPSTKSNQKRGRLHGKGFLWLKTGVRRADAVPVVGSGSSAELEAALAKGMRNDQRR
jgi:hypothetical protein